MLVEGEKEVSVLGEKVAVKEMRSHASAYIKGLPRAAEYREKIHKTETLQELENLLDNYRSFLEFSATKS